MVNKSSYGFGGAPATIKAEKSLSVTKEKMNFMPEAIIEKKQGRVRGENPVGPVVGETMPFATTPNAAEAAEKANYDARSPKQFINKSTF